MSVREKTNAMRVLDSAHVRYQVHTFAEEIHSADGVAAVLGIPAEVVFKTLVVIPTKGKPILAIVPGNKELDLRMMAQVVDEKKLRMATKVEAEALTGLQVGGISALALMNKGFRVFIDKSCQKHGQILVSAGRRGVNLQLAPADLVRLVRARIVEIT
ncbi:MAG: aminoacyl-tRNA deacylase [Chloroflexi bacterium]|nr:aminoacyl-tRNA deacylase [Chloroflexota bacterium]